MFACIHNPSFNKTYIAYRGAGTYFQNKKILIKDRDPKILKIAFHISLAWKNPKAVEKMKKLLAPFKVVYPNCSMSLSCCSMIEGKYDAVILFGKDSFPHFAGSLIVNKAGGKFTSLSGKQNILPTDRVFICANKKVHLKLLPLVQKVFKP